MTQQPVIDSPIDNDPETSTPAPRTGCFEDLIGLFPECDDEFRRVIMEQRKAPWSSKEPL